MDTPEKTQTGTPLSMSQFEDSPVFNYINSLSPIRPVKSIHITQTFTSLSFTSPPVFTSPHVGSHKESRFLRSHNSSDPLKPEFSSEDGNKTNKEVDFVLESSMGEASIEALGESFQMEQPQILKDDCVNITTTTIVSDTNSKSLVPFVQGDEGLSETEVDLQKMCDVKAKNETPDWESLICNGAELIVFSSPNEPGDFMELMHKKIDLETGFCSSLVSPSHQNDTIRISQTQEGSCIASDKMNNETEPCISLSYEPANNLHRGMRRRCLDFEMLSGQRKNTGEGSNCSSSTDKKPATIHDPSRRILPGIGLHLNALAMTSKDSNTNVVHETLHCGNIHVSLPSSSGSLPSQDIGREPLASIPETGETESANDDTQLTEDVSKGLANFIGEEINPSSPKKKRRKSEQAGEGESCKRCNCKKSKCLKLYCECFAAGVYCIGPCSCTDCFNKPIHEDTVLATRKQIESRNPLAFAPKVIRSSDAISETQDETSKTPASARHKRGCNCKKSNCLKKYCECYQGGVGCSINCRCEGCKNAFGCKDVTSMCGTEAESEEETRTSGKSEMAETLQTSQVPNEEQNPSSAVPSTPLLDYRPLVQAPFSSKARLPHTLLGHGSSLSGLYDTQKFGKPNIVFPQSKFEKSFESITGKETEMPEILTHSPITTIKSSSPNSKRVSPPHFESSGSTTGRRSGRKLILQSIPAFPALTPRHE